MKTNAKTNRHAKLQNRAFWLLVSACVTASIMGTHLLLGACVMLGLICTAGVLVYVSNHGGGD